MCVRWWVPETPRSVGREAREAGFETDPGRALQARPTNRPGFGAYCSTGAANRAA